MARQNLRPRRNLFVRSIFDPPTLCHLAWTPDSRATNLDVFIDRDRNAGRPQRMGNAFGKSDRHAREQVFPSKETSAHVNFSQDRQLNGVGTPARSSQHHRMKIATIIARILLGLIFVVFGSNIFLHFIPMPPPPPGPSGDFTKALFVTHYLHVVAVFQILGGLLLLIGRFVPLGLVLLAPVIINIDLVHILMEPSGLPMAIVVSFLLVFLVWRYRDAFAGIVRP